MDNLGFLDFKKINGVPFEIILKALDVRYRGDNGKFITDNEVISVKDNLYFLKKSTDGKREGGTVINYVAMVKNLSLREAAFFVQELRPEDKPEVKIPVLALSYHSHLQEIGISEEMAKALNVGWCEQKGIMNKRICFKVGDHYIGYSPEKKDWLFPKNFKRNTLWNLENCDGTMIIITRDPFTSLALISQKYYYTASIMGANPTEEQKDIIKFYKFAFFD